MWSNLFKPRGRPLIPIAVLIPLWLCGQSGAVAAASAQAPASTGTGLVADATLAVLIEQSLAARPELAAAEARVRAERERVPQAGALPDPTLQVGIQNDGFTRIEIGRMETSYLLLMASQTFPWPGKRGLRQEIAQVGATQATQGVIRVRLATEAEVRRGYLDLVLARDRLSLLDQLDEIWQKSFGVARARYEAGDGAQSDVLRAQLELKRIKQRRFGLQAEATGAVQTLNRLRNHPLAEAIETTTHMRDLSAPGQVEGLVAAERILEQSPELVSTRLAVTRADKSIALAQKISSPDLTLGAGIMPRGGGFPPMWLLTAAAPLPIFSSSAQDHAIGENRDRGLAAQKEVETIEQVLRLRSAERRTALAALVETIAVYQQGLLVQSEATTASTLAQYQVGKLTFASVLETNAGFIADQEGYLQALAAAQRILIADAELSLAPTPMLSQGSGSGAAMPGTGISSLGTTGGSSPDPAGSSSGAGSSMGGM